MRWSDHLAAALAAALVGAVVASGGLALTMTRKVSRPDMVEHVDRQVDPIRASLKEIQALQREQLVEQARLGAKLDALLAARGVQPEDR